LFSSNALFNPKLLAIILHIDVLPVPGLPAKIVKKL